MKEEKNPNVMTFAQIKRYNRDLKRKLRKETNKLSRMVEMNRQNIKLNEEIRQARHDVATYVPYNLDDREVFC